MAKKTDFKEELESMRYDIGLLRKIECSEEETKEYKKLLKEGKELPIGVYRYENIIGEQLEQFYTIHKQDELDKDERIEYILLKQFRELKIIKRCALFFILLILLLFLLPIIA